MAYYAVQIDTETGEATLFEGEDSARARPQGRETPLPCYSENGGAYFEAAHLDAFGVWRVSVKTGEHLPDRQ